MVKVTINPETNSLINPTKNPAFSQIRVEESITVMEKGFAKEVKRSAFINGSVEVLTKILADNANGFKGKIVITESLTPSYAGQEPKKAGKDGAIITSNGMPIYRESFYTDDLSAQDVLITFDKVAATAKAPAANVAVGA